MRVFFLLAVIAAFWASTAIAAAEPPAGAKNFTAPMGVPNYFSNEAGGPMAQHGIVHHVVPEPAYAAEAPRGPVRVAAAHRRPGRHRVATRGRHRSRKLAATKHKHHATKIAAAKAKPVRTATAKSGSERHAVARAKPTETAGAHTAPAKAKQAARHAG